MCKKLFQCCCRLLDIVSSVGKNRESGTGYITWQEVVDNGVRVSSLSIHFMYTTRCVPCVALNNPMDIFHPI